MTERPLRVFEPRHTSASVLMVLYFRALTAHCLAAMARKVLLHGSVGGKIGGLEFRAHEWKHPG